MSQFVPSLCIKLSFYEQDWKELCTYGVLVRVGNKLSLHKLVAKTINKFLLIVFGSSQYINYELFIIYKICY